MREKDREGVCKRVRERACVRERVREKKRDRRQIDSTREREREEGNTATWRGGLYPSFCISRRHKNLYHRQHPPSPPRPPTDSSTPRRATPHAQHRHAVSLRARASRPFAATDQRFHHPSEHLLSRSSRDLLTLVSRFPHPPFHHPRPTYGAEPWLYIEREYNHRLSLSSVTPAPRDGWIDGWMDRWGWAVGGWDREERECKYRIYCMTGPRIPS